jgi:hypothetical protein
LLTRLLETLDSSNPPTTEGESKMEVLAVLIAGTMLFAVPRTLITVLRDGRGHTPEVRSEEPWKADGLPSEPYSMATRILPLALWLR